MRYDSGMAQSNSLTFEVKCPCCEATLQIDPELQIVLHHKEAERKPIIEDLGVAVQNLKGEAARRNDIFEKSFAKPPERRQSAREEIRRAFEAGKRGQNRRSAQTPVRSGLGVKMTLEIAAR